MSFHHNIYCDRRVYDKVGKWYNPLSLCYEPFYYFIKEPFTMVSEYRNGREELATTGTITVFGAKPFAKEDKVILENETEYKIIGFSPKYFESNILVKDMLKQRIAEIDLVLE